MAMFSACKRDVLASETWTWKQEPWIFDDTKSMIIDATDTAALYRMDVILEHASTYGFQNFYIRTLTIFPSGKEVSSITSLELTDADGSWTGDCRGKTCSLELPLQQRFTFPEAGQYTWTVQPYMRMDSVQGINSLTVICRKLRE